MTLKIVIGLISVVPLFIIWASIHEFSHLLAVKKFVEVVWWKMKLYPHMSEYGFRWASVEYKHTDPLTTGQQIMVSLAPRLPDTIAAILFPICAVLPEWWAWIWLLLWGAGIVDLFVGSVGYSENSDLRKAAKNLDVSPWLLRLYGFGLILVSMGCAILLYIWR